MHKVRASSLGSLVLFGALVIYVGYVLKRTDTPLLFACYACLFSIYAWVIQKEKDISFWLRGSFIIRLGLLFSLPNLSDDFYRFIWDGRLWAAGVHPFGSLPSDVLLRNIPGLDVSLYEKLNSPSYFTVYPPVAQFVFWLSVKISPHSIPGSVLVMRTLILGAEAGTLMLMAKLLDRFKLPHKNVLLYALNPLVILELTGNLHFEAFVIFFLLLSVWLLSSDKIVFSAVSFALAIGVKLLPMIFLPLLPALLGWRKSFTLYSIIGVCILLFFIPLYDPLVMESFSSSLNLYFQKFEFNASLYYLLREYGFWKVGYNTIQTTGWKLGVISAILIIIFAVVQGLRPGTRLSSSPYARLLTSFVFTLLIYFIFTTTLHPWYITSLLAFSAFTRFHFAVIWTAVIFLTYSGYSETGYAENLWITTFEYGWVLGFLFYEGLYVEDNPAWPSRA